jgi:hypothetical protein
MYNVNQKMALAEEGVTTKGYNIRMTKDELPPANAFWSFTL